MESDENSSLKTKRISQPLLNFIGKLKDKFLFFQNKPQNLHLAGKIQDMNKTADEVLQQLIKIKVDKKDQIESDLYVFFEMMIDPLIKEISYIQKAMHERTSPAIQTHSLKKCYEWIKKSKNWIQICSQENNPEGMKKVIIQSIIQDFLEVIDRDLQVLEDYMEHMIEDLLIEEKEKLSLVEELVVKIQPYIQSLKSLKDNKDEIGTCEISQWKAKLDKRREKYFDGALHAIDSLISKYSIASKP